jgi:phytoene dehydrogenase-like protein
VSGAINGAGTNGSAGHGAIVVGGGQNGLVAAFYLAKAGMRPLVLERRDIVGGACITEEFAPGFHASSGAYVLSMLRSTMRGDMRLDERGLAVDAAGPSLPLRRRHPPRRGVTGANGRNAAQQVLRDHPTTSRLAALRASVTSH